MKHKSLKFFSYIPSLSLIPLSGILVSCTRNNLNDREERKPILPNTTNPSINQNQSNEDNYNNSLHPIANNLNDEKLSIHTTKHSFKNFNPDYLVTNKEDILVYRIENEEENAYIDLDAFFDVLSGFFNPGAIDSKTLDEKEGKKIYSSYNGLHLIIDWKNNQIKTNSSFFFQSLLEAPLQSNAARFLSIYNSYPTSYRKLNEEPYVIFDLSKYKMDILYYQKKILIPFFVFNTLFVSQTFNNIYFNNETFSLIPSGLDSYSAHKLPLEAKKRIRKKRQNPPTKKERESNFNHLAFVMDYFYGLKEYKKIKSFEDWITPQYKQKLLSTNKEEFHSAYIDIFHKKLNDLHTRIDTLSYYDTFRLKPIAYEIFAKKPKEYYGDFYNKFIETKNNLVKDFKTKVKKEISDFELDDHIRFHNETAIISIFNFLDATNEQINKDDTWKYDTYFLMQELMHLIKKRNMQALSNNQKQIKNIILDLSLNGGGSVFAMIKTLGFLTNKHIVSHDYFALDKISINSNYKVDVYGNYAFQKHNYEQYNWNLLIGINTFSAANQAANITKEMGIAKIIGQKSGGGMASIMPVVLEDGTTITISSPNQVRNANNNEIESGIEPDIYLDYKNFYNDAVFEEIFTK
ncbi:Hypothetical protein, predicted lipoprotein [Metamycoplasma auris 15026]|uniref:Tail specific protease domain-containing protein n=1 Tax=Metamycoplasma auris 15026 TaxID=1188233 RepID=N9V9V3_9BACT|nr:S41 family peptidase [Metamycoplasma auris]ENY68478.1 Hypothetical protein, predicted lipoprotein [Metamycoplasma auris 15026]